MTIDLMPTARDWLLIARLTSAAVDPAGAGRVHGVLRDIAEHGAATRVLLGIVDQHAQLIHALVAVQNPDAGPDQVAALALDQVNQAVARLTTLAESDGGMA